MTKINYASKERASIREALLIQVRDEDFWQSTINAIQKLLADLYKSVLNAFEDAHVEFSDPEINVADDFSVTIAQHSFAADGSGQLHEVWYYVDFGTDDVLEWGNRASPFFAVRDRRFNPNDPLSPRAQQPVKFIMRVVPGQRRQGIGAIHMSEAIGLEFEQELRADGGKLVGLKGWTVERIDDIEP